MKKKQIIWAVSIALILGIAAFSVVKFSSVDKKAKDELNSYYSKTKEKNYPQYVVTSNGVKLRLDPDTSAKELATLKAGSIVDVIKKSDIVTKVGNKEGYWYNVKYADKYGWVFEDFLIEKDKIATDIPQNYYNYLNGLSRKDVKSVSLAVSKFKSSIQLITDKNTKDDMFRKFEDLYYAILSNIQNTYFTQDEASQILNHVSNKISGTNTQWLTKIQDLNSVEGIEDQTLKDKLALLKSNGFMANMTEGNIFVDQEPTFVQSTFSSYVSQGIKEYITQKSSDLKGGFSEDASLVISWDTLSDRIIAWENYTKKYPSTPEAQEASQLLKKYIHAYFYGMDNSPIYSVNNKNEHILNENLQKSYSRFMQKYQNSSYYPIIRNYYNMVSNNNFKITSQALNYLKTNNLN